CASGSSSRITAWPPTRSLPRCSSCRGGTCSSTSTARCRTALSACFARRSADAASWASARASRSASPRMAPPLPMSAVRTASTRSWRRPDVSLPRPVSAVVIGPSAGGVEALLTLLPALPATVRVPVLVVLHVPPTRPTLVAGLLTDRCDLPVREAEDKMPIEPGTVYLAPADYRLLGEPGPVVALSTDEPVHFSRPSIDVLFETAADVFGAGLLGIILTGASSDGADGLDAVRRAGG